MIDLEIHKNNVFNLGDNVKKDMVDFVEGHNTELDAKKEFNTFNFIIFLTSMIIVGIIVLIILFILFWNKKGNLKYQQREEVEYNIEQENEANTSGDNNIVEENKEGDNKISFEESNSGIDNSGDNNINEINNDKDDDNEDDNENDK